VLVDTYTNKELDKNPNLSREQAETIVLTYSTRPGTSEHQTGLAVDMATDDSFSTDFQYTDHYKWLMENAWKFGFILRFPADKTDITTIQFEPWHWRFVGRYHAKKIHDAGVCLEEYMLMLENTAEE
jgi:D-alanyl-D-alanine carboxypeptidase